MTRSNQIADEHADALEHGPVRGRGAGLNPANRFEGHRLHVLGEHLDECAALAPDGTRVVTTVYEDTSREVLNKVVSPDIDFKWTVNAYRGCEHGCIYCYARPTHEYLGMSCGLDFETKIFIKPRAPELLAKALTRRSWKRELIAISGVTDPYQPIERRYELTRRCLKVCVDFRQPVSITTKNRLVLRDLDLLTKLSERGLVHAVISLTSLDNALASKMEPRASGPISRLDTMRELSRVGIPVRAMIAPIIPGLNDHEIPRLLEAAADAGASDANHLLLRLPYQVKDLFLDWLAREFPERAKKVESLIRQCRGGGLNDPTPHRRFAGTGAIARQIARTFEVFARRHGLENSPPIAARTPVCGAGDAAAQPTLFD
jgi:DNA repair photolyase